MAMIRPIFLLVIAFVLALPAAAADYPERAPAPTWDGPGCDAPEVKNRISKRFDRAEAAYWETGVRVAEIVGAREAAFRDRVPTFTARRYCVATVYLTDGARHELVYWLRSEQGFAGYGWGVAFCLAGRDRHFAYAPDCRMLRPL